MLPQPCRLMVGVFLAATVSLLAQSPFSFPVQLAPESGTSIVDRGDFDGDGDIDVVKSTAAGLEILLNDGHGAFSSSGTITVASGVAKEMTRIADVNGDGNRDIVTYLPSGLFFTHRGLGNGTFMAPLPNAAPADALDLRVGRANADALEDVLVIRSSTVNPGSGSTELSWRVGSALGLVTSGQPAVDIAGRRLTLVEDLDADGLSDIVQLSTSSNASWVVGHTMNGAISAFGMIPASVPANLISGATVLAASFGDFDADGDADLVGIYAANSVFPSSPGVSAHVSRRDGASWTALPGMVIDVFFDPNTKSIAAHDLDADGDDDLVFDPSGLVAVCAGDDTFAARLASDQNRSIATPSPVAGQLDLDGDGIEDWMGTKSYLLSSGSLDLSASLVPPQSTLVDLDGDGDLDSLGFLFDRQRNRGDGVLSADPYPNGFLPPVPGIAPNWIVRAVADIDHDGDVDFIADAGNPSVFPGLFPVETHLLINDRDLAATDAGPVYGLSIAAPGIVRLLDVDADGLIDYVDDRGVRFADPLAPSSIWMLPTGLAISDVADADADGDLDLLAIETALPQRLLYFENLNGTSFTSTVLVAQAMRADSARFGDADADGDIDAVAISTSSVAANLTQVFAIENVGLPASRVLHTQPLALSLLSAIPADLDADGRIDIMARGLSVFPPFVGSYSMAIMNAGNYMFATTPHLGGSLFGVGDMDGDKDVDAIFGTSVVANRTFHGPAAGRRLQYESGTPGTDGIVPQISVVGALRGGESIEVRVVGAVGGTIGVLAVGLAPDLQIGTPIMGINTYVANIVSATVFGTDGAFGVGGEGGFSLFAVIPPMVPFTAFLEAAFFDAGAPAMFNCTNGLRIDVR